jgi:hypothetical protein
MSDEWIVVLEAVVDRDRPVDVDAVERLLVGLTDCYPSALHADDRYAVQLVVVAATPDLALSAGLDMWRGAATRARLPRCPIVRAEVKTPAELAAEHEHADTVLATEASVDGEAMAAVYHTTRRLFGVISPAEVLAALLDFVHELGATVAPAGDRSRDAVPVDLSLGHAAPLVPVAGVGTRARRRLEELLPIVIEDARSALLRAVRREEELVAGAR